MTDDIDKPLTKPDPKFGFKFDCYGNHRIVGANPQTAGGPSMYAHPSFLHEDGQWYIGFTQYYAGKIPPEMCEKVFKLVPVDSECVDAPACNLFSLEEECVHDKKERLDD